MNDTPPQKPSVLSYLEVIPPCQHVGELRYLTASNGRKMYRIQCTRCGDKLSKGWEPYPKDTTGIKEWDYGLAEQKRKKDQEAYRSASQQKAQEWHRQHEEYIRNSPIWQGKRRALYARLGGECQAKMCGCSGQAEDVHHLSYAHLGDEPLWELKPVCRHCHQRLHERSVNA